jgi:hypothetical protein
MTSIDSFLDDSNVTRLPDLYTPSQTPDPTPKKKKIVQDESDYTQTESSEEEQTQQTQSTQDIDSSYKSLFLLQHGIIDIEDAVEKYKQKTYE